MALAGVPKSAEHRAKLAAANRGKKLSEETKAKIGAAHRGKITSEATKAKMSAAALGKPKSDAARAAMSAAKKGKFSHRQSEAERAATASRMRGTSWTQAQREKLTGRNSPHWGRSPQHTPRVQYAGVTFRSSWEARLAQVFDRDGIKWEYERHRFDLGVCTYLPDFYLPEIDAYWEVKGWLNEASQNKHRLFRELHPDKTLVVATQPLLKLMRF
jgi:hypothetical protein